MRVGLVGVVVVGRVLPHRVGRVAHDEADVQAPLRLSPVVVGHEDAAVQHVVVLGHLEGVGQDDPVEGRVAAVGLLTRTTGRGQVPVGHLDVRRGDVVGEQEDLIGVQFGRVLAHQVLGPDQPRLEQPHDEGARPREGVEHVHALVAHRAPEVLAGQPVHAAQDEVDDLHRRVHDAQGLSRLPERQGEEPLVQLGDDPLLALGVVDARAALAHRGVEALQLLGLRLQVGAVEQGEHPPHHLGHRVGGREVVAVEHGVEDRLGHQVLREHVDRRVRGDRIVEVGPQRRQEALELAGHPRVHHPLRQTRTVAGCDPGHVARPLLPVPARAHLLHEPGVDGLLPLAQGVQVERPLNRSR